jgi:integrase
VAGGSSSWPWRENRLEDVSSYLCQLIALFGVDIEVQQKLLRHADIRTTMNLYTDSCSADMRVAHSMLAREVMGVQ